MGVLAVTWVRLDDGFYQHPKVVEAGALAAAMQVAALCYSNRNLTDGLIPRAVVPLLVNLDGTGATPDEVAARLVAVGLWDEGTRGAYVIHDYTKYQPSKQQVINGRAQKQAAGQAGGQASARARAKAPGQAKSNPKPVPKPVTDPNPETQPPAAAAAARENAFALYESIFNVPIPNAIVADKILAAEAESGAECLRHCLEEAALNEARSWKYVEAILARHRAEGCGPASTAAVAADEDFINRRRVLHEAKAAAS